MHLVPWWFLGQIWTWTCINPKSYSSKQYTDLNINESSYYYSKTFVHWNFLERCNNNTRKHGSKYHLKPLCAANTDMAIKMILILSLSSRQISSLLPILPILIPKAIDFWQYRMLPVIPSVVLPISLFYQSVVHVDIW